MFSFFDFLFREERTKNSLLRDFGVTESQEIQQAVTSSERNKNNFGDYEESEINMAIVHTRQDIILLYALIQRTNIILRWIRVLLIFILGSIVYFANKNSTSLF